jgi:hypothetical protein
MPSEGNVHEEIRSRILDIIDEKGYKHHTGHSGQKWGLFSDRESAETHFSNPNILVLDENNKIISIIEIQDNGVRPKDIIGIIGATSICNKYIDKSGEYQFNNPSLYIVIKDETLYKEGSKKRQQMDLIKKKLSIDLKEISKYKICSESEFKDVFNV